MNEHGTELFDSQSEFPDQLSPKNQFKKNIQRVLLGVGLLFVLYIIYSIIHVFVLPGQNIKQVYLIPNDAAVIIQTSDPVGAWKKFSNSPTWLCLKKSASIQEVTTQVDKLDSIVKSNKMLLSLVGERDMLISIHKVKPTDWDFLIVVDLQKVSKMRLLKDQMETILEVAGYTVTQRKYNGVDIMELLDPKTRDTIYMAFIENHVAVSYTSKLVAASIDASKKETFELDDSYLEAERMVAGKGLLQIFVNYHNIPQFMSIYLGGNNEYVDMFSHSMKYAGLYFDTNKDKIEVKGYTLRKDTADPYITALLNSGKHKMKAHEIMSARTAFYTNIGFTNPVTFIKELENTLSITDKATFDAYLDSRKKIENLFGFSLEEHFLSWMSGEFAISQSEAGLLGREPELILAIRAKNMKDARKSMAFIEEKIKKRTPIKIKAVAYKGFEVNYVEMKGFFRLFFGGLFDKFEKPYYSYVDDYVVFSNKASSLLSFIEDYEQKNLLKNSEGFKKAYAGFESNSTLFVYSDIHKFYPQLQPMLNRTTWTNLQSNKDILYSFPHWTMQIVGDGHSASLQYVMDYKAYEPEQNVEPEVDDEQDQSMNENAETEKELMTELKRFYVEKFAGNVLREFYPEGALKSETEIKAGKRHGRYREYYVDGTLKVRGKYAANQPKGTWKYYTEDGKFDRKEKY